MEEKKYSIFKFSGICGYVWGNYREKKISLSDYLTEKSHYSCPDTKTLFTSSDTVFELEEKTLAEIRKEVENGTGIFPVNVSTDTDEVRNYLKLGLNVVFMKDRDFRQFKKDYCMIA